MRGYWEYTSPRHILDDDEIAVTVTDEGVLFEVTQEKAVDSYNDTFTCSCAVPSDKLPELIALLQAAANTPDRSGEADETRSGSAEGESGLPEGSST